MWLNDVDGDCVTAEEAFAKGIAPGVFIGDATVRVWAAANDVLNGTDLITVLKLMQTTGFAQNGSVYDDGSPVSVDWTNVSVLQNAIVQGPVKIGVAGDQLETAVPDPPTNGWLATGFTPDANLDHCVSLCGYGPIWWLLNVLGTGANPGPVQEAPGYALFTWNSIGVIDAPSLNAICGEAWLRSPTTLWTSKR
jgi:hypothetical protein